MNTSAGPAAELPTHWVTTWIMSGFCSEKSVVEPGPHEGTTPWGCLLVQDAAPAPAAAMVAAVQAPVAAAAAVSQPGATPPEASAPAAKPEVARVAVRKQLREMKDKNLIGMFDEIAWRIKRI